MVSSYTSYVAAKCASNPSLRMLHAFLSSPVVGHRMERILSIEFFHGETKPAQREISPSCLAAELQGIQQLEKNSASTKLLSDQILVIENINRDLIDLLGSQLAIDPAFFAAHIHSDWKNLESLSPKFCELPSQARHQSFATFTYHRSLRFLEIEQVDYQLIRQSNISRKTIVFPATRGERIGLAQHCCSILVIPEVNGRWLGIVLVDPPIQNTYVSLRGKEQVIIQTPSTPLFGGTEDFLPTDSPRQYIKSSASQSMLEELLYYWNNVLPDDFTPEKVTLRALAYYLLRIIAAEWVNYLAVMRFVCRSCDTPPSKGKDPLEDLDRINSALVSISSWPRRVSSSTISLNKSISFIKRHGDIGKPSSSWAALQEDYEFLSQNLARQGEQLQNTVHLVTAYLQLAESRRAYSETKNVSRLTVLAVVFVPLSFVSSLFSMDSSFGPDGPRFWVYFAVAVPLSILVLLFARPSMLGLKYFPRWLNKQNIV